MPPVEEKADKKSPVPSIKGEKTSDTGITKKCPVCPVCGNAGGNNTALHVSYVEEGSIDSSGGGGTVAAGGHVTNSRRCSSSNSNNSDASSGRAVLRMERERSEEDEEEEDLEEDNNSKRRRKRRRMLRRKGEAADDDDGASSSSGPASLIRPFLFLPLVATANKRRSEKRRRKAEEEARASRWPHRRRRRSSLISEDSQRHQVRLHLRGFTTNSSGTPATPGGGGGGGGSLTAAGAPSSRLSTSHRRMHQRETRTAMRLAVVVCFFITCWLPFFLLYILKPVLPEESFPYVAYSFLTWLGECQKQDWDSPPFFSLCFFGFQIFFLFRFCWKEAFSPFRRRRFACFAPFRQNGAETFYGSKEESGQWLKKLRRALFLPRSLLFCPTPRQHFPLSPRVPAIFCSLGCPTLTHNGEKKEPGRVKPGLILECYVRHFCRNSLFFVSSCLTAKGSAKFYFFLFSSVLFLPPPKKETFLLFCDLECVGKRATSPGLKSLTPTNQQTLSFFFKRESPLFSFPFLLLFPASHLFFLSFLPASISFFVPGRFT